MCEEDLSFSGCLDFFCPSSFTAETGPHGESKIIFIFSELSASPSTVGASASVQLIIARLWVYDIGAFHTYFHHTGHMHQISSESSETWSSSGYCRSPPPWLSPSATGYLPQRWSFCFGILQILLRRTSCSTACREEMSFHAAGPTWLSHCMDVVQCFPSAKTTSSVQGPISRLI